MCGVIVVQDDVGLLVSVHLQQSCDASRHGLGRSNGDVGGRWLPAQRDGKSLLLKEVLDECGVSITIGDASEGRKNESILEQRARVGKGGVEFGVVGSAVGETGGPLRSGNCEGDGLIITPVGQGSLPRGIAEGVLVARVGIFTGHAAVVLDHLGVVLRQVGQVEGGRVASGGSLERLAADNLGSCLGQAEAGVGGRDQRGNIDVLAVAGKNAMVGKGVQARAGRSRVGSARSLVGVGGLVEGLSRERQHGDGGGDKD